MDSLLSDLGAALPSAEPDANDAAFFRIDKGLDRRTLLEVCVGSLVESNPTLALSTVHQPPGRPNNTP